MNLEILSYREALEFDPKEGSYGIRIFSTHKDNIIYWMSELKESENWVGINKYQFDDVWPVSYDAFDFSNFGKAEEMFLKQNFFGGIYGREVMFDSVLAEKILDDYESIGDKVGNVMIHCMKGENRSPAVGIAMNEIYGWGYPDLKKEFRFYRKFVYETLIEEAKKR